MTGLRGRWAAIGLVAALAAGAGATAGAQGLLTPEEGRAWLGQAAAEARGRALAMGWEAFRASVAREPGGVFIVDGDTPVGSEAKLRAFYDGLRRAPAGGGGFELATGTTEDGRDDVWDAQTAMALGYCVSTAFGPRHGEMVAAMAAATREWEQVAQIAFVYRPELDGACTNATPGVVFDVNPGDEAMEGAPYARAFFPSSPRAERNVHVWQSSFQTEGALTLTGILRHELGHAIGLRHEHTRPESGTCFEDQNWRGVTDYDAFSVMHYPQCNGKGNWSLALTDLDRNGIACLYGPAPGFTIDESICTWKGDGGGGGGGDPFGGNYGAGSGKGQNQGPIPVTLE